MVGGKEVRGGYCCILTCSMQKKWGMEVWCAQVHNILWLMYAMIGYHNIFSSGFDDFWGNPLGKRSIKQPQDFILDDCIPWGFLQNFEYILNRCYVNFSQRQNHWKYAILAHFRWNKQSLIADFFPPRMNSIY